MKDNMFEKKLESILKTIYEIDLEVKEYLSKFENQKSKHPTHYPSAQENAYKSKHSTA